MQRKIATSAVCLGLVVGGAIVAAQPSASQAQTSQPVQLAAPAGARSQVYPHIWSPSSPAYKSLPADAPLDPNSSRIVANLKRSGINAYGDKARQVPSMTLNTRQYSNPLWVAHDSDPAYDIQFIDCQNKGYVPQDFVNSLKGVHIPDAAAPSPGTDSQLSIVNVDSKRYVDLWVASKKGNTWYACWGGSIKDASTSDTSFPHPLGTSASGLALEPYTVKVAELQAGHIDHPVALALPVDVVNSYVSKPANRTDGNLDPNGTDTIAEGQYLRLPADFDASKLKLNRTQKIMLQAAKEHGFIVVDRSGSVSFSFQNQSTFASDPYPALFDGLADWQVMWGDRNKGEDAFPFDALQVLRRDYLPNGAPTTDGPGTPGKTPHVGAPVLRQTASWTDMTGPDGKTWKGRAGDFNSWKASTAMAGKDIAGTRSDSLYGTTMWDMSAYSHRIPNGTYRVKLYMAEDYHGLPGQRVFDVTAEGRTVLRNVDLVARTGGMYRAYEPEFDVQVTDGRLDLGWVYKKDLPILCALSVSPVTYR